MVNGASNNGEKFPSTSPFLCKKKKIDSLPDVYGNRIGRWMKDTRQRPSHLSMDTSFQKTFVEAHKNLQHAMDGDNSMKKKYLKKVT